MDAIPHPSRADRVAHGKAARAETPLAAHATFAPTDQRADPTDLLRQEDVTRVPELVPIRYGRMLASAFAFYRGSAVLMAADLADTPRSGLQVQLCGDAHLSNFGAFASPERSLIFDVNDFDETLPGPFEWDVKRLAASVEIAGRDVGFSPEKRRGAVLAAVASYRLAMRDFASQSNLAVWYSRLDLDRDLTTITSSLTSSGAKRTEQAIAKARTKDNMQAFAKLATVVDDHPTLVSDPPLVVRVRELFTGAEVDRLYAELQTMLTSYRRTLQSDRGHLLDQYRVVDIARKVVGVGSVGTRAWIVLLEGIDAQDPLFLQAKEAQASVLEAHLGPSAYENSGQRIVAGQHLMQATSDIFLGWERREGVDDGVQRDYYVRQLRDWKGSVDLEQIRPKGLREYARVCGWTLARSHARSGDRVAIASYLGGQDTFDQAVSDFASAYADQNELDYSTLRAAAAAEKISVLSGV